MTRKAFATFSYVLKVLYVFWDVCPGGRWIAEAAKVVMVAVTETSAKIKNGLWLRGGYVCTNAFATAGKLEHVLSQNYHGLTYCIFIRNAYTEMVFVTSKYLQKFKSTISTTRSDGFQVIGLSFTKKMKAIGANYRTKIECKMTGCGKVRQQIIIVPYKSWPFGGNSSLRLS